MGMAIVIDIIGWAGMALILISYLLITTRQVQPNSPVYQTLNLLGAMGIVINSIVNDAWPSAVLFVVWGCLAVVYLVIAKREKQ
jgi:hypothetical protein